MNNEQFELFTYCAFHLDLIIFFFEKEKITIGENVYLQIGISLIHYVRRTKAQCHCFPSMELERELGVFTTAKLRQST